VLHVAHFPLSMCGKLLLIFPYVIPS